MSFSKKCLPILLSACLLALPACGNAEPSAPESSVPESSAPAESSASQEASQAESGAAAAVPSFTFTEEELLPGGKPAMDEGAPAGELLDKYGDSSANYYIDARSSDLSGENFIQDPRDISKLFRMDFDSKTVWPDNLPEGFDPQQILDRNRNPGLGVRSLHEQGITGKGVNIGIVDNRLLTDHVEYKGRLKMYRDFNTWGEPASMHGSAVASIAVGSTVGVAPEANLYYVSQDPAKFGETEECTAPVLEGLTYLLDLNELLPEKDRLDVISISYGWTEKKGGEELTALVERAKEAGIFVVSSSIKENYGMDFSGTSRDPASNPDDRSAYRPGLFFAANYQRSPSDFKEVLMIPMDYRATASPTGPEDYVNYVYGGYSWAAPYLAGVYALARQVKPDVSPEEFYRLAMETSSDIPYTDESGKEQTLYNLIDPPALIAALEQE